MTAVNKLNNDVKDIYYNYVQWDDGSEIIDIRAYAMSPATAKRDKTIKLELYKNME